MKISLKAETWAETVTEVKNSRKIILITEIPTSQSRTSKRFALLSVEMNGKNDWTKFFLYCLKYIHLAVVKQYKNS